MTLTERMAKVEAERPLPDNVIPMSRPGRRSVPRWIEWTQEHQTEQTAHADLTGYINGPEAA